MAAASLVAWTGVRVDARKRSLDLLLSACSDFTVARATEATMHALATSRDDYTDRVVRMVHNLTQNPRLVEQHGAALPFLTDTTMARGTIIEDVERETAMHQQRFNQMLQEKYDTINQETYRSTLKCRRCGSSEVTWQQKQTRGADESMTCFCTCTKCSNRWTMR